MSEIKIINRTTGQTLATITEEGTEISEAWKAKSLDETVEDQEDSTKDE